MIVYSCGRTELIQWPQWALSGRQKTSAGAIVIIYFLLKWVTQCDFTPLDYTTVCVDCNVESSSVRLSHPAATSGHSPWGQLSVNTESFRVTISSSHTALNAWAETRGSLCNGQYSVLIEWQVSVNDWINVRLESPGTSRCLFLSLTSNPVYERRILVVKLWNNYINKSHVTIQYT